MADPKVKPQRLTDKLLKSLKATGERYGITDATGLRVQVSPTGARSFVYAFKVYDENKGRKVAKRHVLGHYHEDDSGGITLAQAVDLLAEDRRLLRGGVDPLAERTKKLQAMGYDPLDPDVKAKLARGIDLTDPTVDQTTGERSMTVEELANKFYDRRIKPKRAHPEEPRRILDKYVIPALGDERVMNVTPAMINDRVLHPLADKGFEARVNTTLAIVKQCFSWGVANGYLAASPAVHLNRSDNGFEEVPRDRILSAEEIAAMWRHLENPPPSSRLSLQTRLALRLLLLTGVRSGDLRQARWEHVDLDAALWTPPRPKRKTKKYPPQDVPLSPLAVELFKELKAAAGKSPWVMPSPFDEDECLDAKALPHATRRLRGKIEGVTESWSAHDLRRTFRSGLGALGIPPHVAEKCLGHSLGLIEKTYDRHAYSEERREAMKLWSEHVERLLGRNVVALAARGE